MPCPIEGRSKRRPYREIPLNPPLQRGTKGNCE